MTAPPADRFTPPPLPQAPPEDRCLRGEAWLRPERTLGQGVLLLLAGGAAAAGWIAPAAVHAEPAPSDAAAGEGSEAPATTDMTESPDAAEAPAASPLWSPAGSAQPGPSAAEVNPPESVAAAPNAPAAPSPSAAPAASAASQTSGERIQDRLAQGTLTMRSGETLWSLTADLLGPHATAEDVARAWPQLWEANADQIRDPDIVLAGTVLQVPPQLLPEH